MDALIQIVVGAWVPQGFCEKHFSAQEDFKGGFAHSQSIDISGEELHVGVVPYSDEFGDELMGVLIHEDAFDNVGTMDAKRMMDAFTKASNNLDLIKNAIRDILPEKHKAMVDGIEIIVWGAIPW